MTVSCTWLMAKASLECNCRLEMPHTQRTHCTHTVHTQHIHTVHTRSTHTQRTRSSSVSALSPWFFVFVKKCIKPPAINCYSLSVCMCVCQRVSLGRIRLGTHCAPPHPLRRVYSANWSVYFSLARSSPCCVALNQRLFSRSCRFMNWCKRARSCGCN